MPCAQDIALRKSNRKDRLTTLEGSTLSYEDKTSCYNRGVAKITSPPNRVIIERLEVGKSRRHRATSGASQVDVPAWQRLYKLQTGHTYLRKQVLRNQEVNNLLQGSGVGMLG